jgi:uncharacterized membrane-anchored protein
MLAKRELGSNDLQKDLLCRVPQITALFWVVKILTTGMGEVFSDYMNYGLHIDHSLLLIAGAIVLAVSLVLQFAMRRYVPWVYWLVVVVISIYGTILADTIHEDLGVPYIVSAASFMVLLAVILALWHRVEGSLSIHSVKTWQREAFYWATVIVTFCLGTALGDTTADNFGWGTLVSGLIFTAIFIIPAVGYRWLKFNDVFAFWFAYILTRPLGASYADWLSNPSDRGGLGLGSNWISLVLSVIIVALVGVMTVRKNASAPLSAEGVPA